MSGQPQKHWYDGLIEESQKHMHNQTRTNIIVSDALHENVLGDLLGLKLHVEGRDDVLDSLLASLKLGARAKLAYAIGIIEKKTMQDLQQIHNIRNKWAHQKEPNLSDEKLKKNVLALSTVGNKEYRAIKRVRYFFRRRADCMGSGSPCPSAETGRHGGLPLRYAVVTFRSLALGNSSNRFLISALDWV